jgi:hypothetical protein
MLRDGAAAPKDVQSGRIRTVCDAATSLKGVLVKGQDQRKYLNTGIMCPFKQFGSKDVEHLRQARHTKF